MGLSPSPQLAVMAQALGVGFSPTYRGPVPEFQSWAGLLREKTEGQSLYVLPVVPHPWRRCELGGGEGSTSLWSPPQQNW